MLIQTIFTVIKSSILSDRLSTVFNIVISVNSTVHIFSEWCGSINLPSEEVRFIFLVKNVQLFLKCQKFNIKGNPRSFLLNPESNNWEVEAGGFQI